MIQKSITYDDILDAKEQLIGRAIETPLQNSKTLGDLCKCHVYLKLETMQKCHAYKFRGAYNRISRLPSGSTVV
jgi:threonine dehydratase